MKKIFLTLTTLLFASACQTNSHAIDSDVYQYKINNTPISISFDAKENRFSGKVVNNYFGTYEQKGENISLHPLGATMMMGPAESMKAEQEWLQLLLNVKSIKQEDSKLIFTLKNGQQLFLFK